MILVMDIGNTNIKTALFSGAELVQSWRIATNLSSTSDEYGIIMEGMFQHTGHQTSVVEGIMISSVVPTVNFTIEHMCRDFFGVEPAFVVPGIKTGINILYENPRELGSDRICNAVAASALYGSPCIYIDFGSATSFGAISRRGDFLGGCICTGVRLSQEAVVKGTSKLPHFEMVIPDKIIARTTITNLQSGLLYGYVGQVNYIVAQMREEMGEPYAKVVATGGFAHLIAQRSEVIDHIDGLLTLKGIRMVYEKNRDPHAQETTRAV
ncbi:MAG: type III pantothenate kinase [Eubacteriales bacterium]|jgi:type III pantothenate kinase|nr:type III pantothenate kinase [Eubacteriales bacterium]MDD4134854.1 type III pantothenate kinase [Eubacteriales bacterium]NLO12775.1 type III pantothenate kinase [Clostridiales bacterium]